MALNLSSLNPVTQSEQLKEKVTFDLPEFDVVCE
jgi:hypothetical protein